ncbi:MAG TPA: putative LPS assembly protein LptD, partial [Gemmatimonadales bacterium]|nr:putative LPS assembly protein LptD [Gemmatimonadales bacterium]
MTARAAGLALLLGVLGAGALWSQRPTPTQDTTHRVPGTPVTGRAIDTATARRLGLPTGPTRGFPASDALMDSLAARKGYRITHYTADTLVMRQGRQGSDLQLQGTPGNAALVDQDGSKLQADSIHYVQTSCRLEAQGAPSLFGDGNVMIGDSLKYDNCLKRGVITNALTSFKQGGATWFMRGDLAVDSGSTRMFGASSSITSSDLPLPDYHFQAGEVKWLNKNVMIARPAVLYIRDVPLMWLPFIFQDIRLGRRSGVLVPRFGLNDLVRPTRSYQRHVSNLGYYWVPNDYVDLLGSLDWFSNRYIEVHGAMRYKWLNRFIDGGITYAKQSNLDGAGTSTQLGWNHSQAFDSRTHLTATVNYATSAAVIQQNTINPFLSTAQLSSQANFQKQFDWGTVNIGGSRSQNLSTPQVSQTFPQISFTPSPVNLTPWLTWSPGLSYTNSQTFHNNSGPLLVPAGTLTGTDTLSQFFDNRSTALSLSTPIRIGNWNWSNSLAVNDQASNQRQEVFVGDDNGVLHKVLYVRSFRTTVDWSTGFTLPSLFSNSWKLQPSLSVVNATSQGPTAIRNQFTNGQFISQGKRPEFGASLSPTFFGFFPGFGPLDRIRHSVQLLVQYAYAPSASVSPAFAHAIDPSGRNLTARSDPQQTISVGLSQNIEAKLKPPPGDTTGQGRKLKLLSLSTSPVSYNFERAKQAPLLLTGWQTQTLTNTMSSDLIPGFSLSLTHDLWNGPVGYRVAKFSPFLTNVSASFSISEATIRGIGGLLGLGGETKPATPAPGAGPNAGLAPGAAGQPVSAPGAGLPAGFGGIPSTSPFRGPTGGGFSMNVSFTSTRFRPVKDSTIFAPVQLDSQYQGQPLP